MSTSAPPTSFSVYRGQARTGIGEGPGKPIAHGEQYLRADPPLGRDGARLREIRPWMSLDADPADLDKLGDALEAWSAFDSRDRRYVVRLVRAEPYDRRQAYFSHGRAWPIDACRAGFDPGAHLGRSQAFEQPWRDQDPGERVSEPDPGMVRPEQVRAEEGTAVRYLTHLVQARADSRPLIIAAPVGDFIVGGALHALVSFARAALPSDLKSGCRIRVYTRNPELFLGHLGADLLVVPEAVAAAALAARRDATLLDRGGERGAGRDPDPRARAYAEAVVERACKIPASLLAFSARFGEGRSGVNLPTDEEIRTLQISYNLAFALAGPEERRGDLLRKYLIKKAGELGPLPWDRLIGPHEWRAFPREAVLECLLRPVAEADPGRGPGGRALQRELEGAAARLGLEVDPLLDGWWTPGDAAKVRRLLELVRHQPPLVSARAAAGRLLTSGGVCAQLEDRFLLQLGLEVENDDGLRRLYRELDRRMADPDRRQETSRALIEDGWWPFWRRQTELTADPLRAAALAWLGAWSADGVPEAALEDWKQVLEDLGPQAIPGVLMATLCDGGPRWPWIPPFEGEQLEDLARAAADLGALAELAEAIAPGLAGLPAGTDIERHLLARSGQGDGLPERALLWLTPPQSGQRPALSLDAAHRLEERCGHRRQEARAARVTTILAHLDRPSETRAALDAAAQTPSLWREDDPAFLDGLARWMLRRGSLTALGEDYAAIIDRHLAAGSYPAAPAPAEGLAGELAGRFNRAATFLASRPAARRDGEAPASRLVAALVEGDVEGFRAELMSALARLQRSALSDPHPLRGVAAEIRAGGLSPDRRQALERKGWATFEEASRDTTFLAHAAPDRLPALDLALALSRPGRMGSAALAVALAPGSRSHRTKRDWWRALLHGLRDFRRFGTARSLDDRTDTALALLLHSAAALDDSERNALDTALACEARHWPLISEFGVTTR